MPHAGGEISQVLLEFLQDSGLVHKLIPGRTEISIVGHAGVMVAGPRDWIVRENGKIFSLNEDIFRERYKPAK